MFTLDSNTGRLILARMVSPMSVQDFNELIMQLRLGVLKCPTRVVLFGDCTELTVVASDTAEQVSALFARDNPKVERSAFLLAHRRSTLGMQLDRLVREAGNPARRVFDDLDELLTFIDPVLDGSERATLRRFMTPKREMP